LEVLTKEFYAKQLSVIYLESPKLNGGSTILIPILCYFHWSI